MNAQAGDVERGFLRQQEHLAPLPIPTGQPPQDLMNIIWCKNSVYLDTGSFAMGGGWMTLHMGTVLFIAISVWVAASSSGVPGVTWVYLGIVPLMGAAIMGPLWYFFMQKKINFLIFLYSILFITPIYGDTDKLSRGIALYNQNDWVNSQAPLREAAKSGNRDAQYYLGEALRLANRYMTDEAIHWYIAAAEQGDLFAMLRLSRSDDPCIEQHCEKDSEYWEERANATARKQAENNDSAAMHALYFLTGDRNWLKKAADAGDSEAGYFLARLMLSDTMDKNTGRIALNEEAREYLEKSAKSGNPNAIELFSTILSEEGDSEKSREWLEKCLLTSHHNCILRLEMIHQDLLDKSQRRGYHPDKAAAYGLLLFRRDALGLAKTNDIITQQLESSLTAAEKKEGEAFFKQWKETHPPLSFHVRRFGF